MYRNASWENIMKIKSIQKGNKNLFTQGNLRDKY